MYENRLKRMIHEGVPAVGCWIGVADPSAVEVIADAGFDWLLIDMEHSPIGPENLRDILVALKGSKSVPLVRLMANEAAYFKTALDLGAEGVVVPMVESGEDARRVVQNGRYPPLGVRGFSPMRASQYFRNIQEYLAKANEEILLIPQVESVNAAGHVEAIAGTPGIDGIFIGSSDLASSMNFLGQPTHPDVQGALERLIARIRSCGVPFGIPTTTPEEFAHFVERGATLLTVASDIFLLRDAAGHRLRERKSWLATKRSCI
jgi:2-dehydro-3-deoxyglucarate aldolase